jgi:hypothetical protein
MENVLIKAEDLQVGDEIMISCQSYFKYLRVLTPPTMSKTRVNWHTKKPILGNFRCTTRQEEVLKYSYTNSQGQVINRMDKEWIPTAEDHNLRVSQDLNSRQIWLVKRGTEI